MSHTTFNVDKSPIAKDDPRYVKRVESQHRLAFAPGLVVGGAIAGFFLTLPFAVRATGFPLLSLPTGVITVFLLLGIGLIGLALVQGIWRLIPAFWSLYTSLDELSDNHRLLWQTLEIGLTILGFGAGVALAYLLT